MQGYFSHDGGIMQAMVADFWTRQFACQWREISLCCASLKY
jgi:hypothetical protein